MTYTYPADVVIKRRDRLEAAERVVEAASVILCFQCGARLHEVKDPACCAGPENCPADDLGLTKLQKQMRAWDKACGRGKEGDAQ